MVFFDEDEPRAPAELYVEPHWYACYTRARHERRVEERLRSQGIESYLPELTRTRQWKDRKKRVSFPIFPGYVFGRFTLRQLYPVLSTPGVSTIIRTNGYPTPIPSEELDNVRRFVEALETTGTESEPRTFLAKGERVRVIEGPFVDVEGIVVDHRGRKRVLVGLEAIGQGLEINIPVQHLKAVKAS